jgi:hypothetical protein
MSGQGGDLILELAEQVLKEEFPEVAERIRFHIPDEREKRHGQAIAAASLASSAGGLCRRCSSNKELPDAIP